MGESGGGAGGGHLTKATTVHYIDNLESQTVKFKEHIGKVNRYHGNIAHNYSGPFDFTTEVTREENRFRHEVISCYF